MKDLIYVTGNPFKFKDGMVILKKYGIDISQKILEITEIQHSDGEIISRDKANQAYEQLHCPLITNDTIWMIPALNNFPGAYMKHTNDCFIAEDWLRLMNNITDRRIIMREIVVYKDADFEELFYHDVFGVFLLNSDGNDGSALDRVISMRSDQISVAKARENGGFTTDGMPDKTSYDKLGLWLNSHF